MKNTADFNLSFRPDSYWVPGDPVSAIVSDLKGEQRRRRVRAALEEGRDIPDFALDPLLGENDRKAIGQIHPLYMGGEYLPPDSGLAYRVVDEYEFDYELPFEHSTWPLTMGELTKLMDGTLGMCCDWGSGLVLPVIKMNYGNGPYSESLDSWADSARRFVTVSSEFYLELQAYYRSVVGDWVESQPWVTEEDL